MNVNLDEYGEEMETSTVKNNFNEWITLKEITSIV